MRWVLPGGAVLGQTSRNGNDPSVVCRAGAAVLVRAGRRPTPVPEPSVASPTPAVQTVPDTRGLKAAERLAAVKLLLEVLAVFVGLVAAVLALFGVSRK